MDWYKVWCHLNKIHSRLSPPQPYSRSSRASGWGCDSKKPLESSPAVPSHGLPVKLTRPELLSHHPEANRVWQTLVRGGSPTGTGWPLLHTLSAPSYFLISVYSVAVCGTDSFFMDSLYTTSAGEHVSHDPPGTFCVCAWRCACKDIKMSATDDPCWQCAISVCVHVCCQVRQMFFPNKCREFRKCQVFRSLSPVDYHGKMCIWAEQLS